MIDRIQEQCKLTLPAFRDRVLPIEWMPRGILTSEGLAFCAMGDLYGLRTVVESGVAQGRSSEMWARYWPLGIIRAIDRKLPPPERRTVLEALDVGLVEGDTTKILRGVLDNVIHRDVGVFIDGPKGVAAVKLAVECMALEAVKFVGVHDLSRGLNSQERQLFEAVDHPKWFTDEIWFSGRYHDLDSEDSHWDEEQGTKWAPFARLEREPHGEGPGTLANRGSYGYTIGFLYKELPA